MVPRKPGTWTDEKIPSDIDRFRSRDMRWRRIVAPVTAAIPGSNPEM
jgi:hypothetical protein